MNDENKRAGFIPLPEWPIENDAAHKQQVSEPLDVVDFDYRGLSKEERLRRAAKDMEAIYASDEPPAMPKQVPRFVKAYLWNTPSVFQPAFSQPGITAASVLMDDVSFKHTNDQYYPAKLNTLLVGPSGVGKNSVSQIFKYLLADLMKESHDNMEREVEINDQNNLLGSNAKRKAKPDDLVQRIVFTNTTTPALAKQMKQNNGLPCFMEAKEIEDLYCFKNGAGGMSPLVLLREADDPDGKIRQRRVGEKSVTADVPFHMNYCVSTQLESALSFFKNDMTKGGLSRQEVAFIPEQPIGAKEGKYKVYDERYVKRLQPFIDNLKKTRENAHADEDGRIICVGTTSTRTLESVAAEDGTMKAASGWTDIFIYPGYRFKVTDGLITNFHLPESTLVMLVSAFSTRENILRAYQAAIDEKYRFFSFGDAMFII